ncbi:FecR family protein [Blastomonas natatoria]|uniref:FecR family protein n=1 Tax=Blastomonas natatoria TaxID=34015 RepID=A0A2V3V990_9SPHN|nr:FecR domain-containing protein [Blastomonas natatoria]PXW78366.1 FecR family protein [Blastomonas natatoria]
MTNSNEHIRQEALEWALATQETDFAGWAALTEWLEADARHGAAYDEALAAGNWMAELVATAAPAQVRAANDQPLAQPRRNTAWRRRGYIAMAAALLAVLLIPVWQMRPQPYDISTRPGETRTIVLDDDSRILLNGNSRLALDRARPRFARLDDGEAMFEIRHDEADPFVVESGDARLVDAGTAFNVMRNGAALDVAVSEGAVIVNPDREAVRLQPGRKARIDDASGRITVSQVAVAEVGGWRSGQLSFADASLTEIAAALERTLGTPLTVSPAIVHRRFSGVLQVQDRDEKALLAVAPVLGTRAVKRPNGWELVASDAQP